MTGTNVEKVAANKELTKEEYIGLKDQGKTDTEIIVMVDGLYRNKLTNLKKQWGLIDYLRPSANLDLEPDPKPQEVGQAKQPPRPASIVAKLDQFEDLQKQLDEKDKTITSYAIIIENLKNDLYKKSEMINLLKSLLREVL